MLDQDTTALPETGSPQSGRVLDPLERSSEIMFGLIMALTFTCSVSVVASTLDVRTMLISALGCDVAWGLIDAAMYVLGQMVTRQQQRIFAITIADASPPEARRMILERMPDGLERHLSADELDRLVKGVQSLLPHRDDLRGASGIFLLVFLSTFPVALPFLLIGMFPLPCASQMQLRSSCSSWWGRTLAAIWDGVHHGLSVSVLPCLERRSSRLRLLLADDFS